MNDTISAFKDYWKYFNVGEGYKVILRMIPFYLTVGVIISALAAYAVINLGLNFPELARLGTGTADDAAALIESIGISVLQAMLVYIAIISIIFMFLSVGLSNSFYQSVKEHILNGNLPTIKETYLNALKGYGRYFGYMALYVLIPTIAITFIIYAVNLTQFSFVQVFITSLIQYFFLSKLLRIDGVDFLVPCLLGMVMVVLSIIEMNSGGTFIFVSYIISMLLNMVYTSVGIYTILRTNGFMEGHKYE